MNKIKQSLQELSTHLSGRKTRFQAIWVASQDFKEAFDHFIVELDQLEKKQQKNKDISVQWKVVKGQHEEQIQVESKIDTLKSIFDKLYADGMRLVEDR